MDNVCLAAVSVYGNDNRSIVDALQHLKGDSRAVVSFDPHVISDGELERLHLAGARGVRINLKTKGETPNRQALIARLQDYSARIRSRGWILQLYVSLEQVALISDTIPELGVRVVLDHMASPDPSSEASSQTGYKQLVELLSNGDVWVKISGSYRFAKLPDLDSFARTLIKAGPERVVWASDWPHTGGPSAMVGGRMISTYRRVDDKEFVRRCFEWCDHDKTLIQNLFVNNPRQLWLG